MGEVKTTAPLVADKSVARSKRKIIIGVQVLLAIVIVLVLIRSLSGPSADGIPYTPNSSLVSANPSSSKSLSSSSVPQTLGGLNLINVVTGQEAISQMSELHGKDVGLSGGWVGHYQSKVTAWVGETPNENSAVQLMNAMVSRIGASNGVFTNLRRKEVDGFVTYAATGLGQNHYFYQKGNKVIWLAMPVAREQDFLRDALQLIN